MSESIKNRYRSRRIAALSLALMMLAPAVWGAERRVIGLAGLGPLEQREEIEAWVAGPKETPNTLTIALIGGLAGEDASSKIVRDALNTYEKDGSAAYRVIAIPVANPRGVTLRFPPEGVAYRENPESNYLWRWLGAHGPDLVLIAGDDPGGLAGALATNKVAGVGTMRTARLRNAADLPKFAANLTPSPAHLELTRGRARSPRQLADELSAVFGHDFDQLTYLPGMALIGQLRLGNVDAVEKLAHPYLDPDRDILARASSLTLAGHQVFAALAERLPEGDLRDQYIALVKRVGDLGFDENGNMKESMPFHGEMSDSYFMAGPITTKAGKFTGDSKYFDMVAQHFRYLRKLTLREDGLHRHSPLTDAAWSRGNSFPALGLALTLTDFPEDHPDYEFILKAFQDHMEALAAHQDPDGMWNNVIDVPGAYPETSATSMIATAMLRGIRHGWLDAGKYQPIVDRAWQAVLGRISTDGVLIDVCESTNKQPSMEAYLDRAAVLGPDMRGGGMALLLATEMAGLPE